MKSKCQRYQNYQGLGVDRGQTPASSPASQLHGGRHDSIHSWWRQQLHVRKTKKNPTTNELKNNIEGMCPNFHDFFCEDKPPGQGDLFWLHCIYGIYGSPVKDILM